MGQTARLRLIRDRFIAGHESCDLRRYLDCVPPDTPLRDIVDRCRVWESHADPEVRRISKPLPEPVYPTYVVEQPDYETEPVCVVTVNKPNSPVDQSDELLKKLLAVLTPKAPPPARAPDESPRDKLVQLLFSEAVKRKQVPPTPAEPPGLETLLLRKLPTDMNTNRYEKLMQVPPRGAERATSDVVKIAEYRPVDQRMSMTTVAEVYENFTEKSEPTLSQGSTVVAEEAGTDGTTNVRFWSIYQKIMKTTNMQMPMDFLEIPERYN